MSKFIAALFILTGAIVLPAYAEEVTARVIEINTAAGGIDFKLDHTNQCGSNKYSVLSSDPQRAEYENQLKTAAMFSRKVIVGGSSCSGDRVIATSVKLATSGN